MPSVSLTASEADFFGLKSDSGTQKKSASAKPAPVKPAQAPSPGAGAKALLCALGFVIGSGVVYASLSADLARLESEKIAYAGQIQSLSAQVSSLQKSLAEEKEKARVVPAPEFPASPMFQSQPQPTVQQPVQPQQAVMERPQEQPRKAVVAQPVHERAKAGVIKAAEPKTPTAQAQPEPSPPQPAVEQKRAETQPPKFLPVLMLPANKTHVASVDEGSIVWRFDNGTRKTIKIGEPLPSSGETLIGVDPSSTTLWTDKQIISIIKE